MVQKQHRFFLFSLKTFESAKITEIAMKKPKCLCLLCFDLQSWECKNVAGGTKFDFNCNHIE